MTEDNKLRQHLQGADDRTAEQIARICPAPEEQKEDVWRRVVTRISTDSEQETFTVTEVQHRSRGWMRIAGIAAAFVIVCGAAGGILLSGSTVKQTLPRTCFTAEGDDAADLAAEDKEETAETVEELVVSVSADEDSSVTVTERRLTQRPEPVDDPASSKQVQDTEDGFEAQQDIVTAAEIETVTTITDDNIIEETTDPQGDVCPDFGCSVWNGTDHNGEAWQIFFYGNGGGLLLSSESNTGVGFEYEIIDETRAVFHLGSAEDETNALITWYDDSSYMAISFETGLTIECMYDTEFTPEMLGWNDIDESWDETDE